MLCFDKLTGECNNKTILLKFLVLWKYIFNTPVPHGFLGADHLIPGGGGLWFFVKKKDCSANFGK